MKALNQSLEDYEYVQAKQVIKDFLKKGDIPDTMTDAAAVTLIKENLPITLLILEEMGGTFSPNRELGENTTWEWVLNRWLDQLVGVETQWFDAILEAETMTRSGFVTNETIAELVATYIVYDGPTCLLENPHNSSFVKLMEIMNPREIGVTSLVEVPITELASNQQATALERYYNLNGVLPRWNGVNVVEIVIQNAGSCPKATEAFILAGTLTSTQIDQLLMNVEIGKSQTSLAHKYLAIMSTSGKHYSKETVRELAQKYIGALFNPEIAAILDYIRS